MQHTNQTIEPAPTAQLCGIMISIFQSIQLPDIFNAAVCAATGTIISFVVTMLIKNMTEYIRRHREKRRLQRRRKGAIWKR